MQMKRKRIHTTEANSLLSQQLQLAMKDMHQVESELDAQLTVLVTMGVIFASLFAFLDYRCYEWWAEWIPYIKWIVLIALGIIEAIVLAISLFAYDCNMDKIRAAICRKGKMKQLKIMGYVEIYEPDFEKKSLLWAGTKGFITGLISI